MKTLAVARNTFLEARRDRVQWILLFYAVLVFASAYVLSPLALGEGYRVTRDLGLAALSVVGVVLIVLVGGGLVHKEIERRTVLTVLAKPIERWEFLIGKYLGMMAMVTAIFLGMIAFLTLVVFLREGRIELAVIAAAWFSFGELMILTAAVVTFSAFATPALAGVFALSFFVVGRFAEDLIRFAEKAPTETLAAVARGFYLVLPHLEIFNLRNEAAYGVLPDLGRVIGAAAYALAYSGALLALGSLVFTRREFR